VSPISQIENEYSSAARVSILARLVPVVSLCLQLIGEALCAVLLMRVLEGMRNAEAAGIAAVAGGMAEANLAMTVALYFGLFVGFIGVVVLVIRAFTVSTTASPSALFFALAGLLTLVPLAFLWAAQSFFLEGLRGGNISLAAPNIVLFLRMTIGASVVLAPILLIATFIPLPSIFRAKNKWAPAIILVLIMIVMIGTAVTFQMRTSWLYRARDAEKLDF
jgi:hypothetical protein